MTGSVTWSVTWSVEPPLTWFMSHKVALQAVLVLEPRQINAFIALAVLGYGLVADLAQSAAAKLPEGQALKQIGKHGVPANALDVGIDSTLRIVHYNLI